MKDHIENGTGVKGLSGPDPRGGRSAKTTNGIAHIGPNSHAADVPADALVYDTEDICRILRIGHRTAWRWSHSGVMPAGRKISGRVLWPAQVIRDWVAAGMPRCDGEGD